MGTFRTVIVDDERLAREELKRLLKDFLEIEIIGEAKNGEEGLQMIEALQPDLVFLDVNMPGLNGFEMIQKLEVIPNVVFVSAYDEYAVKAFEVKALDYVLKPVDPQRLQQAIGKIKARDEEVNFMSDLAMPSQEKLLDIEDHVFIKDGEKCFFIPLSKVRMFESDGNYVKVFFDQSKPLILRSLNSLEERLSPKSFFRANRKYIINLHWITAVENWFNGGLQVTIRDQEKIEISRRQAIRFKELFTL